MKRAYLALALEWNMKLLTPSHANTKMRKGGGLHRRYLSYILHLAPANLSGNNVCPMASDGCKAACLNTAGRGQFNSIQNARINKTKRLFSDRSKFMDDLFKDLLAVTRKAKRESKTAVVRLNGTSDLNWSSMIFSNGMSLIELFSDIQFYDYTKVWVRFNKPIPKNYHLTFSRSECNQDKALELLSRGINVAVVFKGTLPKTWQGFKVLNGDAHDFRFLDKPGYVVGLTAKGKAKHDTSGFVIAS